MQPPFRLTVSTPSGGNVPVFSLTSVYTPANRQNLAAFVAVDAAADTEDYGTLRVLRLSSAQQVPGPGRSRTSSVPTRRSRTSCSPSPGPRPRRSTATC
ncbi:MAG: UPF0182 family protein [Nocardioides sp.]